MNDLVHVLAGAVVAPTVLGLGIVRAFGLSRGIGLGASLAYGYLAGQLALAPLTLMWLWLGQPTPGWSLPALAVVGGGFLIRRCRGAPTTAAPPPWPWWAHVVVLAAVAAQLDAAATASLDPIRLGDESVIWAAKAKVLFTAPHFAVQEGFDLFVQHADYPLLQPLTQVLAFASAGHVLHWENRLPVQAFGVALLLALAAALRHRAAPLPSALVLLAFGGSCFLPFAMAAYADVPVALATLVAVEGVQRARAGDGRAWWRLACCALAALLVTKNEGRMLGALIATVAFADHWRRRAAEPVAWRAAPWLLLPIATVVAQMAFDAAFALHNDLFDPAVGGGRGLFGRCLAQFATHAPVVCSHYGTLLLDPAPHRLLPLLALVSAPWLAWRTPAGHGAVVHLAVFVGGLLAYAAVFVGTNADLRWHLDTAAARTLLHVLPLAAIAAAAAVAPRTP